MIIVEEIDMGSRGEFFGTGRIKEQDEILKKLIENSLHISTFIKAIDNLKRELSLCTELSVLHKITGKIITKKSEIAIFVRLSTKNHDAGIIAKIKEHAEIGEPCYREFLKLLNFYNDIAPLITQAKERITLSCALALLNESEQRQFLVTVTSIKSLALVIAAMDVDKSDLQARLALAPNRETIDDLEKRIMGLDRVYKELYRKIIVVPNDKKVLEATKDFLHENPHLQQLLVDSEFEEDLTDSVLHALGRMGM